VSEQQQSSEKIGEAADQYMWAHTTLTFLKVYEMGIL
jgi:hypothetical protein